MTRFVAVDVETANPQAASICQVGVARFDGDHHEESWTSLVDPGQYFEPIHVRLHGITADRVRGHPTFAALLPRLRELVAGTVAVTFSPFARGSLDRACDAASVPRLVTDWVDAQRLMRRAMPPSFKAGFGLADAARELEVPLERPHDALAVALATGQLLHAVCKRSGRSLADVFGTVAARGAPSDAEDGLLAGEVIVFTGSLVVLRKEAAEIASSAGGQVGTGVTRKTTMLVVGDQEIRHVGVIGKSSKHLKAEKLISGGQAIRIIGESDFFALVKP